jgi:cell division protein FtsW
MSAELTNRTGETTRRRRGSTTQAVSSSVDIQLIAIIATFLLLGLVMVLSASYMFGGTYYFVRQALWVVLGVVVCAIMTLIPYRVWQRIALPFMLLNIVLLVAVLFVGDETFGAGRTLFNGRFQPSELAKLAVVVYVAAWVAAHSKRMESLTDGMLPFLIIMGLVAGLIVAEKSFSVTIIVLAIGLTIFFVGGGHPGQLFLLLLVGTPFLLFAMYKAGYAWDRITGWYNVWFNPTEAPDQLLRLTSMLREGRGSVADPSIWQAKASVPGLWSDYLFANIGADLPIIGTFLVVALYAAFGYRALGVALNAPDRFGSLTAIGLTAWITIQAAVHIGTSLTLIPPTGQPLPFMSYGGSSLLSSMAAAGLLLSISRAATEKKATYAHFAFGWGNWRPRLPRPRRGERAAGGTKSRKERTARRGTAVHKQTSRTGGGRGSSTATRRNAASTSRARTTRR